MLIFSEIKKLIKNRSFLLYVLLLLLVNLFLIWFFNEPNSSNLPQSAYRRLSDDLAGMNMEQKGEYIAEQYSYIFAMYQLDELYSIGNLYGEDDSYYQNMEEHYADKIEKYGADYAKGIELRYTDSLQDEFIFINEINIEYQQVAGYDQFLADINEAGNNLSTISIFADTEGYDYKNIISTKEAYDGMQGTEIDYHPQKALITATGFTGTDIVMIFVMIIISFTLIHKEKEMGILRLIRSTAAGRTKTAATKVLTLAIALFVVVTALYGTNIIYCGITFGLGDLGRTVQSVPELMRSTLKLTVGEYILAFMITKWMAALICGAWILLAMLIANRFINAIILSLTPPILFYLLRQAIPATSNLNVFRYANPISYLQTDEILGTYRNLHWFGGVISMVTVEFASALIFALLILVVYFLLFKYGQFSSMGRNMMYLPRIRRFRLTTVFKTEWRKLLLLGGGLLILFVAIVYQGYQLYSYNVYQGSHEQIYKRYMQQLTGPLNNEKVEFLYSEEERFAEIEELEKQLFKGTISEQQFNMALAQRYMVYEEYKTFKDVVARVNYVQSNPGAQLIYDGGYRTLFELEHNNYADNFESTIIAILLTVVILGNYFSIERMSGVRRILYSTPLGREQTVKIKLINSAVICMVISIITTLPNIIKVARMYGLQGMFLPAKSIPEYAGIPFFVSLFMVLLLHFILRVIAIAFVGAVTLTLSQYNDSYITVIMISLTIFLLPMILMFLGLDFVSWVTVYPQFNITALLSQGAVATAIPIFFAAVMMYASYVLCERMVDKYCWNFTDL